MPVKRLYYQRHTDCRFDLTAKMSETGVFIQTRSVSREEIGAQTINWLGNQAAREVCAAFSAVNGMVAGAYCDGRLCGVICAAAGRSLHISCVCAAEENRGAVVRALFCYAQEIAEKRGIMRLKLSLEASDFLHENFLASMGFVRAGEAVSVFCRLDERGKARIADWLCRGAGKRRRLYQKGFRDDAFFAVTSEQTQKNVRAFLPEYPFLQSVSGNHRIDTRCSRWVLRDGAPAAFCVISPQQENRRAAMLEYLGCLSEEKGMGAAYLALTGSVRAVLEAGRYQAILFSFRTDNTAISSIMRNPIVRETSCATRRTAYFVKQL